MKILIESVGQGFVIRGSNYDVIPPMIYEKIALDKRQVLESVEECLIYFKGAK